MEENTHSPFNYLVNRCHYYEPHEFYDKWFGTCKSASCFHLNCRSLSYNWNYFHDMSCQLRGASFSFDIIGISEVFNCDKDQRLAFPGYHNLITRCRDNWRWIVCEG